LQPRLMRVTDTDAVTALINREIPEYGPNAAALQLVVGNPAIAFLDVVDRSTTATRRPGVCQASVYVGAAHRRQGIGSMLLREAERFAREREAHLLRAQGPADAPGYLGFLAGRGFLQMARRQTWTASVREANRLATGLEGRLAMLGLWTTVAAVLPKDEHRLGQVYDLLVDCGKMDPLRSSLSDWAHLRGAQMDYGGELLVLAYHEDRLVGVHHLEGTTAETGQAEATFTGTAASYRGCGIAHGLKAIGLRHLREREVETVLSTSRTTDFALHAVNRRLGFVPGPEWVVVGKHLPVLVRQDEPAGVRGGRV